jgi:hypothetical protein
MEVVVVKYGTLDERVACNPLFFYPCHGGRPAAVTLLIQVVPGG